MNLRVFSALALAAATIAISPIRAAEPDPKAILYTLPDKINWKKGPVTDSVMLQGDDRKPGIYIQLLRWHSNNMSRPHSHDMPRYVYVVSGTWWVGAGAKFDPASTKPIPAGSYVTDIPNELHYDGAKDGDCVLMIVGMGPMKTTSPQPFRVGPISEK